jgi:uncharacterized lipoprotein YehR (DUF1307 family)
MKNHHLPFLLLACLILFTRCTDTLIETPKTFEKDYEYFPLSVGKYIVYEVDSITYRLKESKLIQDSVHFQAKEEIVDTLYDNLGVLNYKIEYFERKNSTEKWQVKKVWRAQRGERQAIRTEEGFRSIKMTFPLTKRKTWNANVFIDNAAEVTIGDQPIAAFKDWKELQIADLAQPEKIGKLVFDDILSINTRIDATNQVELRRLEEKYARGVGLVSKTLSVLDTQCDGDLSKCIAIPWEKKAERGFRLRWVVKGYN